LGADNLIFSLHVEPPAECGFDLGQSFPFDSSTALRDDKPKDNRLQGINSTMPRAITMQKIEAGKPGKVYYPCVLLSFPFFFLPNSSHFAIAA